MYVARLIIVALALGFGIARTVAATDYVCGSDHTTACTNYNGQQICPLSKQQCQANVVWGIPPTVNYVCPANSPGVVWPCANTGVGGYECSTDTCIVKPPPPKLTLSASPASIVRGQSATITWSATDANTCAASGGWTSGQNTSGSQIVSPTPEGNYSYSMSCAGYSGSDTASVAVGVTTPAPTVTVSVSPASIMVGDSATLVWSSTDATSCTASDQWSGSQLTAGQISVGPPQPGSYTYALSCSGAGGSGSASATLTVNPKAPPPPGGGGGCSTSSKCVCSSDLDHSGAIDQPNELATCDSYSGQSLCPIERVACTRPDSASPYTCPSDSSAACVDTGGGNSMCSKNRCGDANSAPSVTTDVNQSTPKNDGPRDAAGNCLAKLRIFPGAGKRCHKAGNQTVWQNCCKNDMPKLSDTMGRKGERPQRDYKEEKSKIQFWSNQCDTQDQETSLLADSGYCIYLGEFCAEKWAFVGCVQKDQAYCCFNSLLAKIIQEQGRPQLPAMGGYGTADQPVCRGFSPEEFQALDFSKIDLSGYYSTLQYNSQATMQQQGQDAAKKHFGGP